MNSEPQSATRTLLTLGDREIILIGTAHVSASSVEEVARRIAEESPDRVAIELDQGRYQSMVDTDSWTRLDIFKVIKSGKGFLLLSNLLLSSYQKRLGSDLGVKPGSEMKVAIDTCASLGIPWDLVDREIAVTLRRAWAKSSLWGKAKLMAALLSSAFGGESVSADQIESMKRTSELHGMLDELGDYLPTVKSVLIDERDQYMATELWNSPGKRVMAILGAGHVPGITRWLEAYHAGTAPAPNTELSTVPVPGLWSKVSGWILPAALVLFLALGFVFRGADAGWSNLLTWLVYNGGGAALGSLLALGHPLTILVGFLGAPLATLNPFLGIGMFTGLVEAWVRKPRVSDLENLQTDITSLGGFFRNRVTRVLLVFVLSSIGALIGNGITLPLIAPW